METLRETPEGAIYLETRRERLELVNLRNRVRAQREEIKRLQRQIAELKGRPEICGFCGGYNVGTCSTCELEAKK